MAIIEKLKTVFEGMKHWPGSVRQYFAEVWTELKKVSWPSGKEVYGTTIVVIVTVFVFGFYLWLVDILLEYGITHLFRFFGTSS